jgi:hypothetical protein
MQPLAELRLIDPRDLLPIEADCAPGLMICATLGQPICSPTGVTQGGQ